MKISTRSRYGLKAIASLAIKKRCCSTKEISKEEDIPFEYLEKIFTSLKKSGLLEVKRGASGGYLLAKSPQDISVGQVLQSLEGEFAPVKCISPDSQFKCPHHCACLNQRMWQKIQDRLVSTLNSLSLASLIK